MPLTTVKPRLATLSTDRVGVLMRKAGTVERLRGSAGMAQRTRIAERDGFKCGMCGSPWVRGRDHVDHRVSLEEGGTNDDENLWLLCSEPCHRKKSEREAAQRARGRG